MPSAYRDFGETSDRRLNLAQDLAQDLTRALQLDLQIGFFYTRSRSPPLISVDMMVANLLRAAAMKYHFSIFRQHERHFRLQCLEIFHCSTTATTCAESPERARSVLAKHLLVPPGEYRFAPPLREHLGSFCEAAGLSSHEIMAVPVEPATAFALSLRHARAVRGTSQERAAGVLGIKLSAYQRLEDPRRTNPTLKMMSRLKRWLPHLELSDLFES